MVIYYIISSLLRYPFSEISINLKIKIMFLTHLAMKNENCPNLRTATPKIVAGDMICFVVGNKLRSAGVK